MSDTQQIDSPAELKKISRFYISIALCICATFLLLACLVSTLVWKEGKAKALKRSKKAAFEVEKIVQGTLREARNLILLIGKEIGKEKEFSLEKVASHLQLIHPSETRLDPNYVWSYIDWVTPNGWLCVSSKQGILSNPVYISEEKRRYILQAPKTPWELIICPPAYGIPSGTWIVPIAMGVIGWDGNFLGIVTAGFNIDGMNQKIDQALRDLPVEFLVMDKEMHVAFDSFFKKTDPSSLLTRKLINGFDCFKCQVKERLNPINEEGISFFYYEEIENSPYDLFIGIDQKVLKEGFYLSVIPKLIEIFCAMLFCLIILAVFWKKQVLPLIRLSSTLVDISIRGKEVKIPRQHSYELQKIGHSIEHYSKLLEEKRENLNAIEHALRQIDEKNKEVDLVKHRLEVMLQTSSQAEQAREKFIDRLNQRLSVTFEETISLTRILWNYLNGTLDLPLSHEQELSVIQKIIANLQILEEQMPDTLTLSEFEPGAVIEESVKIFAEKAALKNIEIKVDLTQCTKTIFLDELLFQKLIIGLLSNAFYNSVNGGMIEIVAVSKIIHGGFFLEVMVHDNGLGLQREDFSRLENIFKKRGNNLFDFKNIPLKTLEKIAHLHGATIQFDAKWKEGTSVVLLFPCNLAPEKQPPDLANFLPFNHA